jgi:hypothetical protein
MHFINGGPILRKMTKKKEMESPISLPLIHTENQCDDNNGSYDSDQICQKADLKGITHFFDSDGSKINGQYIEGGICTSLNRGSQAPNKGIGSINRYQVARDS